MSDLLDRIVEQTQRDLNERRSARPKLPVQAKLVSHRFAAALRQPGLSLIAEIKPKSPSKGHLLDRAEIPEITRLYGEHAQAISVLVDHPFFGGGFDLLQEVRQSVSLPLLAKGFIVDPYQIEEAVAYGADAILLIVRILSDESLSTLLGIAAGFGIDALVEVHTDEELERAQHAQAPIIGVNARDLDTLQIDLNACHERLSRIPHNTIRVAESGLDQPEDIQRIKPDADAALIGTAFLSAPKVEDKLVALGW
ncbi:MAG: indole-3-glycerol phosphate synthase TrpC [Myxococcales bacterium]|nr:indole-3-glycerol phosphate synthase TrpC [Myxococcales bacterium]